MSFFHHKNKTDELIKKVVAPIHEREEQLVDQSRQATDNMTKQADAIHQDVENVKAYTKDANEQIKGVQKTQAAMGEAVAQTSDTLGSLLDHLSEKERYDLFQESSKYDVTNLDDSERKYLIGYLISFSELFTPNELQQDYIRHIQGYLHVTEPQIGVKLDSMQHIDDPDTLNIMLQTAMEYDFLNDPDHYESEALDWFNVGPMIRRQMDGRIRTLVSATGPEGLVAKYGLKEAAEVAEADEREREFAAKQAAFEAEKKAFQAQLQQEREAKQRAEEEKTRFHGFKQQAFENLEPLTITPEVFASDVETTNDSISIENRSLFLGSGVVFWDGSITFTHCLFNMHEAQMWLWMKANSKLTFVDCKFVCSDMGPDTPLNQNLRDLISGYASQTGNSLDNLPYRDIESIPAFLSTNQPINFTNCEFERCHDFVLNLGGDTSFTRCQINAPRPLFISTDQNLKLEATTIHVEDSKIRAVAKNFSGGTQHWAFKDHQDNPIFQAVGATSQTTIESCVIYTDKEDIQYLNDINRPWPRYSYVYSNVFQCAILSASNTLVKNLRFAFAFQYQSSGSSSISHCTFDHCGNVLFKDGATTELFIDASKFTNCYEISDMQVKVTDSCFDHCGNSFYGIEQFKFDHCQFISCLDGAINGVPFNSLIQNTVFSNCTGQQSKYSYPGYNNLSSLISISAPLRGRNDVCVIRDTRFINNDMSKTSLIQTMFSELKGITDARVFVNMINCQFSGNKYSGWNFVETTAIYHQFLIDEDATVLTLQNTDIPTSSQESVTEYVPTMTVKDESPIGLVDHADELVQLASESWK